MANFIQSFFDINAPAAYDVEEISNGGGLRLRCRPSHATSLRPVWVMDGNQVGAAPVTFGPTYWYQDLAAHKTIIPDRCQTLDGVYKRFAGDAWAVYARPVNTACVRQANLGTSLDGSFTLDLEWAVVNILSSGMIASYRAVVGDPANMVFDVTYNGSVANSITINFYSGVATTYTATLSLVGITLVNSKYYDLRITFDRANSLFKAEMRDPATDARVTVTKTGAAAVNIPTGFNRACLIIGGAAFEGGANGTYINYGISGLLIQRAYLYDSFLDTGLFAIAARPTFYAATTAGDADGVSAVCTIDSGVDDSEFDPATLDADDDSLFAAAIGAGGWEFRYQITNDAVPSVWSAWMTWAALQAEAAANGRYFHLGTRATSDGYNEFYPVGWFSCEAATYAVPATPVLSNFLRDEAVGSVDTTGDVDSTIEIWGASLSDEVGTIVWQKIGERVGPGAVVLDFTAFTWAIFGLTVVKAAKIVAIAINPAGAHSPMSNVLGFLIGDSAAITIAGEALDPAGTLTFTVAGLADPDDIIVWFSFSGGALTAHVTTGNGAQTWAGGFNPNVDNSFTGIPQDRYGHLLLMPLMIDIPTTSIPPPYCRPRQAPGLEERNP